MQIKKFKNFEQEIEIHKKNLSTYYIMKETEMEICPAPNGRKPEIIFTYVSENCASLKINIILKEK